MKRQSTCFIMKLSLLGLFVFRYPVLAQAETEAVKEFNARVKAYMELQNQISSKVPPLAKSRNGSCQDRNSYQGLGQRHSAGSGQCQAW